MRLLFAVVAGLLALCVAAAAGAAPPTGDPKGLALLERVRHAYLTVPAVGISTRLGPTSFDFKLVLLVSMVAAFAPRELTRHAVQRGAVAAKAAA